MPANLDLLLDENIPLQVLPWLRTAYEGIETRHVSKLGLRSADDQKILQYAIEKNLVVLTYDEDFTARRMLRSGHHSKNASQWTPPRSHSLAGMANRH